MKLKLNNRIINEIVKIIKGTKYENKVFVVGGFVRDLIIGTPSNDVDLLIDGDINAGIEFAEWFCKTENIYKKDSNPVVYGLYGTAMIHFMGEKIECVAPRSEKYEYNSRKPMVESCSIKDDCFRRDFTMNSMFINITTNELVDYSGFGYSDIQNKIIRTTSNADEIFNDDSLRILRCIRQSAKFNFNIENETYEGAKRNVHRLNIISKERIRDEFVKILVSDNPDIGISMLFELGAMKYVVPNLDENDWFAIERMFKCMKDEELIVKLAALYMYSTNPKFAMEYLKFSKDVIKEVLFLIETASEIDGMEFNSRIEDIDYYYDYRYYIRKLQYKCKTFERLDKSARVYKHFYGHYFGKLIAANDKEVFEGTDMFDYKLPINGDDVMQILGIGPSKNIKYYLNTFLDMVFMFGPIFANKEHLIEKLKSIKENEMY